MFGCQSQTTQRFLLCGGILMLTSHFLLGFLSTVSNEWAGRALMENGIPLLLSLLVSTCSFTPVTHTHNHQNRRVLELSLHSLLFLMRRCQMWLALWAVSLTQSPPLERVTWTMCMISLFYFSFLYVFCLLRCIYFCYIHMSVLSPCMCSMCVHGILRCQKMAPDHLELEFMMVVSHHVRGCWEPNLDLQEQQCS